MFCGDETRPEETGVYLFSCKSVPKTELNQGDWVSVIVGDKHFSARVSVVGSKFGYITTIKLEEGRVGSTREAFIGYRATKADIEMYRTHTEFVKTEELTNFEEIEI